MKPLPRIVLTCVLVAVGCGLGANLVAAATITINTAGRVSHFNAGSIIVTGAASGLPEATSTGVNFNAFSITTGITTVTDGALMIDVVGSGNRGSFDPGTDQTERWDVSTSSASGAMSTKTVDPAGFTEMIQTHTPRSNRHAHALVAVTPEVAGVGISVESVASRSRRNRNSISWDHPNITSAETAKLFVGVAMEDGGCPGQVTVTSVTYGNLSLKQLATIQAGGRFCARVDIWYVDLPHLVLSAGGNASIGGVAIDREEAAEYDAADNAGILFLADSVFSNNPQLNGIHLLDNGNVAVTTEQTTVVGGVTVDPADVIEITTGGAFVQLLFNGDTQFSNTDENVDAVWIRDNGNIIMSTAGSATLGGATFRDEDIFEFDPVNPATLLFDGSAHISGSSDVDAVHVLDDDSLLLSIDENRSIAGVSFDDGDVILFDTTSLTASLHMSEAAYSNDEDTDAISLEVAAVAGLDHFDITFAPAGSTCVPSEIVIKAKDLADATITTYTGTVGLSTSSGNGDWTAANTTTDPAQGSLIPGAADSGAATYSFVLGDAGDIAILLANEHAETLTVTVADAGPPLVTSNSLPLNLTFADNAFVITPTTSGGDSVVAGRDHIFHVEMVRRDGTDCGIATGYNNAPQPLKAWIERDGIDPGGVLPTLAEETDPLGDNAIPPLLDNLELNFLSGESDLTLETTDVGKFVLNIRDDSGGFADGEINGATNTLTVRPFGYDVQITANPGASAPGGAGFVSAGTDFTTTVRAVAWELADDSNDDGIPDGHELGDSDPANNVSLINNPATLAYGKEPGFDVALSAVLVQPNPAPAAPALSGATNIDGFTLGEGSTVTSYDEVGIIEIRAQVFGGSYLGGPADVIQGVSGFVGRFFPDHFDLDLTDPSFAFTNRSDLTCTSAFTYMDEDFSIVSYLLLARNVASATTENYDGAFAFANPTLQGDMNFGAVDTAAPTNLTSRLSVNSFTGAFVQGVANIDTTLSLLRAPSIDGPFDVFNVGIAPVDPVDNVSLQTGALDLDVSGANSHAGLGSTVQRFGRLFLESTFGSEIAPLPMPMQTEFFDGSGFVIHNDANGGGIGLGDSCTPLAPTDLILSNNLQGPETDGDILIFGTASTTATIGNNPLTQGDAALSFTPPGAGNTGHADVTTALTILGLPYLLYDWDSDGLFDNDPQERATFGIFQGSSVIIYQREPGF